MKRFITLVSVVMLSTTLVCSTGQSRGRNNSSNRPTTSAPQNRPGNMGGSSSRGSRTGNASRPSNGTRPGGNNSRSNNGTRPGGNNSRPDNGYRPGGNNGRPDNGYRPGGNNGRPDNGYRPGGNNGRPDNGYRPGGNNSRPDNGYRPGGYRPGSSHTRPTPPPPSSHHGHYVYHNTPPYRPDMPCNRHWRRPTPPPSWHPYHGCPTFSDILGVTLGTALNLSLDYLFGRGYSIVGYGTDQVYLSNVPFYNYTWPTATLYYGSNVGLQGSEFVYSSLGYDMSRYNALYTQLVRQYGYPVSVQDTYGGVTATWWGYNNGYITLSFFNDVAYNGTSRYYTTLSIGN